MTNCKACRHPNRQDIDQQIVAGTPLRTIGASTGLSLGGLVRHKAHIKDALNQAMHASTAEHASQASDLLERVHKLADEAIGLLETAKASNNLKAGTAAICAAVRCLELCGRLDGSLAQPHAPGIHFLTHIRVTNTVNNYADDREVAELVSEATHGFSPIEIERLKALLCNERATRLLNS